MFKWSVIDVELARDYKLILTFWKERKRIFDFRPLLDDKINEPLKNVDFFMTAKVHHNTVMWNDEIDVCPEYLYEKICKIPDNYIGIFYGWFYISN